ncbi:MAG: heavy metal transporter [Flavobacterium sp.]|nr:MAG: heavy metal transporter [Flavobacterium sp.]
MKTNKSILGAGVVSAIAASLCCITPVLALIAGTTGMAASFSWIEPLRPYLLIFTVLVLGFAWYQQLKTKKIDCDCEEDKKSGFFQSKTFLFLITIFAIVMSLFPYYSSVFYPSTNKQLVIVEQQNIQKISIDIEGMTCEACEQTINYSIGQLDGIVLSEASFEKGNAIVEFDQTKTNSKEIEEAVNKTGYKAISTKKENDEN